jgi:hypothetical protein
LDAFALIFLPLKIAAVQRDDHSDRMARDGSPLHGSGGMIEGAAKVHQHAV